MAGSHMNKAGGKGTIRRYIAILTIGGILTVAGAVFSLLTVSIIPQGEGPPATALVGGGQAEDGGVTFQIGNYTIVAGDPVYTGELRKKVQSICRRASHISDGKSTQDALPLSIEPTGTTKCLANGQTIEADGGRLTVQAEAIGVVQARPALSSPNKYLPLSKVDAQVWKTTEENLGQIVAIACLAFGPTLAIGGLIPLLLHRRKSNRRSQDPDPRLPSINGRNLLPREPNGADLKNGSQKTDEIRF